jgi:hypothetical protein
MASSLSEPFSNIPLGEIFLAASELVARKLIEKWALGGALAGVYYTEPVVTYDADIFFIPADKSLSAGLPSIYAYLQSQGWHAEGEHLLCGEFPVQLLAAHALTEEAVREALAIEYEGVTGYVFRAEYIVAIAASVGRLKDRSRIEQIFEQASIDQQMLDDILKRYRLKLPPG